MEENTKQEDFIALAKRNYKAKDGTIKEGVLIDVIKKVSKEKFTPPTPDQVSTFVKEKLPSAPDVFCKSFAEKFCGHYESVGWKVGKNPMKSWQGAVNKWSPSETFRIFQEKNKSHKQFNAEKTKL